MIRKYTLLLAFLSTCNFLFAQWQPVALPGIGSGTGIGKLYYDGNVFWAGGTGQIFKSIDQGNSWMEVSTGLQSGISGCSGITKVGDRVYASFSGNGNYFTYYTTNEGVSWNLDTAGWSSIVGIMPACVQLITHKDYVVARLESNFVLYKKNTDSKWNVLNVPNGFKTPGDVFSYGDSLCLGAANLALSADMGGNWDVRYVAWPAGLPMGFINGVYHDRQNAAKVYGNYQVLATTKPILFRSNDNQILWDSVPMDIPEPNFISGAYINGSNICLAYQGTFTASDTTKKFFISTNGGFSWNNLTGNLYSFTQFKFHSIKAIEMVNGKIFAAGFAGGLVRTDGPTGLEDARAEGFHCYPVPAQSTLYFDQAVEAITITDLAGKVVVREGGSHNRVDISALAAGVYVVEGSLNGNVFRRKFTCAN